MMSMRKSLLGIGVLAALLFWLQYKTLLGIAESSSLPWKVYLVVKGSAWKKGDIVTIQGHTSSYSQGIPLLTKRVVGGEGDVILLKDKENLLVGDEKISPLLPYNSKGKPLHPVENQIISRGYVFVVGDDPRSFDSRYQEFGLVKAEHILGRSFPLW